MKKPTAKFSAIIAAAIVLILVFSACGGNSGSLNSGAPSRNSGIFNSGIPNGRFVPVAGSWEAVFSSFEFSGNYVTIGTMDDIITYTVPFTFANNTLSFTDQHGITTNLPLQVIDSNTLSIFEDEFVREGPQAQNEASPWAQAPFSQAGPPAAGGINLNLPLVVQETNTHMRITADGELQGWGGVIIATNVRYFAEREGALFFIKADNTLWGMGYGRGGQLGDGTGLDRAEPILIAENVATLFLHPGRFAHPSALQTDGTLLHWGGGIFYPVEIATDVVRILTHGDFQKSTGHIYHMDLDETELTRSWPEPVYTLIRAHAGTDYIIDVERNLIALHFRTFGFMVRQGFEREEFIAEDVASVFPGGNNGFFIKSDGTLWGMGRNSRGELGDGTRVPRDEPIQIAENVIHAGDFFFLKQDGTFWAWGSDDPTPRQHFDNVAVIVNGIIHFNDESAVTVDEVLNAIRSNRTPAITENVRIPRTLVFN